MGIETIPAPPTQHVADFRVFGPHLLLAHGNPVDVPPYGPSELLALLLLAPDRRVEIDELRKVMEDRRFLSIHAAHAVEDLNTVLDGTGLRVHTGGFESAREYIKGGGQWSEPRFFLTGGPVELDLDRCGALIGAAIDAPSANDADELFAAALLSIEGDPLAGVANSGSQFTHYRTILLEARTLLDTLRYGLNGVDRELRLRIWRNLTLRRNPVIATWDHLIRPSNEAPSTYTAWNTGEVYSSADGSGAATTSTVLPASIYLGDGASAAAVEAAIDLLLTEGGLEAFRQGPPLHGSWYRSLWVRVRGGTSHLSAEQLTAEIERKLRIEIFDRAQATIDLQQATGAAALITALQPEDVACIRLGSMLLVKLDGTIQVTNLTQVQIAWIERNQMLLRDPEGLLKGLATIPSEQLPHASPISPAPPPAAIEAHE